MLRRFPGASLAGGARDERVVDELNQVGRPVFGVAGPAFRSMGWSVFPQTKGINQRMPGIADGRMITYKEYVHALPPERLVAHWAAVCPGLNVAAIMGPASGVFAVDIDVTDRPLADRIYAIAVQEFGPEHYVRSSGGVKVAIILGLDPSDPVEAKRALPLLDDEGRSLGGQAVEILANGSPLTIWGNHHRTGERFTYGRLNPIRVGLDRVARVGAKSVQRFLERVDAEVVRLGKVKQYDRSAPYVATGEVEAATLGADGIVTPGGRTSVRGVTYERGRVVDGREAFLQRRAVSWISANLGVAQTPAGRAALAAHLHAEAVATFEGLGSRFRSWHGGSGASDVLSAARLRIESAHAYVRANPNVVARVGREENGRPLLVQRVAVKIETEAVGLRWLGEQALGGVSLTGLTATDEAKAVQRAIRGPADVDAHRADRDRVAASIRTSIGRWIDECYERARDPRMDVQPIQLLKAPTGAGKTSTLVEMLAERKRQRGPMGRPVLVLMPSYNNIEESIARARGSKATAEEVTQVFRKVAAAAQAEAEGLGLDVGVLTGKERGGCRMSEALAVLRERQVPATGLCVADDETGFERKARIKTNRENAARRRAGEDAEGQKKAPKAYCHYHPDNPDEDAPGGCPVILARRALVNRDVIFAPHAFIGNAFPSDIGNELAGVAIDERIVFELLHHTDMPLLSLDLPRAPPPILPADDPTMTADGLLAERLAVVRVVWEALADRRCPAQAIWDHPDRDNLRGCVGSARLVCQRGQKAAMEVKPNVTVEHLLRLFSAPGQTDIRKESRLWKIISERLDALASDEELRSLGGGAIDPGLIKAHGAVDRRLQLLAPGTTGRDSPWTIRMSWRSTPNFAGLPTLLLDASADVEMVRKCWGGREVVEVSVPAYLHVRTVALLDGSYATSSFDVSRVADEKAARAIAKRIAAVRRAENILAHVYGSGRVLTVAPMRIRKALRIAYGEAPNIDAAHYGALRGLDFAKWHRCVMTVGRHEFPVWVVDALAAALTYDDDEPEAPCDVNGDGIDPETGAAREPHTVARTYKLRDGRDLTIPVSEMPHRWGRAVQRQFREEEQRQAMGRLRPVYRDCAMEPPVWVAMSKVLPEDTVIDAVTTLEKMSDLNGAGKLLDAVRRVGVLDVELLAKLAPDLKGIYGHPGAARNIGLDRPGAAGPFAAGFDHYVVNADGTDREVLIPAYHEDPTSAAAEAYDAAGMSVRGVRLVASGSDPQRSQVKALDKVDAELGGRDERYAAEEAARAAAVAARAEGILADPWQKVFDDVAPRSTGFDVAEDVVLATQAVSLVPEEPAEPSAEAPTQPAAASVPFVPAVQPRRAPPALSGRPAPSAPAAAAGPAALPPASRGLSGLRALRVTSEPAEAA
ncbi:hypothetical protein A3862_04265 [Methylobacterium sp. XJLW]|uniref:hypothetical protein n=1 Tax=Methylobacterium sp. XJLW TaxID=739141 RepID=UPI000DAB0076|nr:hypothetical protein [Methylobacterium sp. XJLW]AWV14813.1 hypothetical protein A3862_04265 [Methylobacterium sp. XJLW]